MRLTETEPSVNHQAANTARVRASNELAPPIYPMPSERSKKSAIVVPIVVVATITAQ